jgi:restriction system protein
LLLHSVELGVDRFHYEGLKELRKKIKVPPDTLPNQYQRRREAYFKRRSYIPPWEGITWVIDLLPHHPARAIGVLDDYFIAHCFSLPDGCINALGDATALIRAKFIGVPKSDDERLRLLMTVSPRHFECLVERLYSAMRYSTELTPPSKDGGRDVIASRTEPGSTDLVHIECKRYSKTVGVPIARQLLGVVSSSKAPRGVVVGLSGFTKSARDFAASNPRLELISGLTLIQLFNSHLGSRWDKMIDRLVMASERENAPPPVSGV